MGINFSSLISTCASLFLLIVLGFILRKTGVTDEDFSKKLSTLVAKAGMPFLMI